MNYYNKYTTDIKRTYKVPQRFLDHLEARASMDRAKEERYGSQPGKSVFCYTPFSRHHFSLMVKETIQACSWFRYNEMEFLDGMMTGWFCGYQEARRKELTKSKGYSYTAGLEKGSALFHFLESETIIRMVHDGRLPHDERFARLTPSTQKFLEINLEYLMEEKVDIWHLPRNCDECALDLHEDSRIIGRLDGTEDDADTRYERGMVRATLRELAYGRRFIREDAKKASEFDDLWQHFFGTNPKNNPYRTHNSLR